MANNMYIDTSKVKNIYLGTSKVKKIYRGTSMIWQSAIPISRPTSQQLNPSTTYDGSSHGNGFSMTGVEFVSGTTSGTNAGTYKAYYRPDEEHIWSDTEDRAQVEVTLTINKATGWVSGVTNLNPTYNGGNQYLCSAATSYSGTVYYARSGWSWSTDRSTAVASSADTYTVYYYAAESANYTQSQTYSISCSVAKANCSYTAPTNASPNYNGTNQYIMTSGSVSGGTMYYRVSGGGWSTTRPSSTNAGSWDCYWYIAGDSNHNGVSETHVWCNLNRVSVSYTAPVNNSPNYNGSDQYVMTWGSCSGGTIYYRWSWAGWQSSPPATTNAGSWDCYWYIEPDGNHTGVGETYCWCNLNKAAGSCWSGYNASPTYNGGGQNIIAGCGGTGTILYYWAGSGWTWTSTVPNATDAGAWDVYYLAAESDNYTQSDSRYVWCNMNQRSIDTFTVTGDWQWYDGSTKYLSVSTVSGAGMSATYSTSGTWATSGVSGDGYWAYVTGTGNFCGTLSYHWYTQFVWYRYYADLVYAETRRIVKGAVEGGSGDFWINEGYGKYASWGYGWTNYPSSRLPHSFNTSNGLYTLSRNETRNYGVVSLDEEPYGGALYGGFWWTGPNSSSSFTNVCDRWCIGVSPSSSDNYCTAYANRYALSYYCRDGWYVYETTSSYQRGSYITAVGSLSSGSYPSNGRAGDGYWYTQTW